MKATSPSSRVSDSLAFTSIVLLQVGFNILPLGLGSTRAPYLRGACVTYLAIRSCARTRRPIDDLEAVEASRRRLLSNTRISSTVRALTDTLLVETTPWC